MRSTSLFTPGTERRGLLGPKEGTGNRGEPPRTQGNFANSRQDTQASVDLQASRDWAVSSVSSWAEPVTACCH